MKMKKTKITKLLKLGILLFGVSLLLWNCEEQKSFNEVQNKKIINLISLDDFKNRITEKNLDNLSKYFKGNSSLNKDYKSETSDEFIILTDNIAFSQKDNKSFFTFQIIKETYGNEFYNLILTVNEQEEVIKSEIYEYIPSAQYNSNTPTKFVGSVRTYKDDGVNISGLINLKSSDRCIVDSVGYWECSFGNNHEPGNCNGAWFTYNVRNIYGPCPTNPELVDVEDGGNSNGPFDPPTGGGGSGNDNNDDPNDDTDTTPVNTTTFNLLYFQFIDGLTPEQLTWFNDPTNRNETGFINDYLETNGYSSGSIIYSEEVISTFIELDNFEEMIEVPTFDALDDNWIKDLRDLAQTIEDLRTSIPESLYNLMVYALDLNLRVALTTTALFFNSDVATLTEAQKIATFQSDGYRAIGILLFEFANGLGPDVREIDDSTDFWFQYFAGDRINQIKADFEAELIDNALTFDQFEANGNMMEGNNGFSPDHTDVITSFNQHINANWVQFFVGGTRIEYRPTNQPGYIDVKVINPTSRKSVLLHQVESYDRDDFGNIPLSTIEQHFFIRIQVR
mgnify:CR=1 FL=1|tara:strand:- start:1103 stop:2794 length:1692 start_codon:yes stop_codon:yes gene_type:complete